MGSRSSRNKKKPNRPSEDGGAPPELPAWARESLGIGLAGVSCFLLLALVSYAPETDPGFFHRISPRPIAVQNWGGIVGSYAASLLKETLGLASYFAVGLVALCSVFVLAGRRVRPAPWKIPAGLLALLALATLFCLAMPHASLSHSGGILGHQICLWLLRYLHPAGSYLFVLLLLLLALASIGELSLLGLLRRGASAADGLLKSFWGLSRRSVLLVLAATVACGRAGRSLAASTKERLGAWIKAMRSARPSASPPAEPSPPIQSAAQESAPPAPVIVETGLPSGPAQSPIEAKQAEEEPLEEEESEDTEPAEAPESPEQVLEERHEPERAPKARSRAVQGSLFQKPEYLHYQPPPLELLDHPDVALASVDRDLLLNNARALEQKLRDFGVEGRVTEVHPGPIITLFEYEPAPGVKVNRIVNLADDLALALKAMSVRIVAPIPGKSVVGIEVPNPVRQNVYLKEILGSETYRSNRWKLPLALGKDIAGKPVCTDLSRMPHLLIAGATGTGKSVCLHSLILSLLFRFSPQEVRFLMIDPKMLELTAYHGIPHLLHPVITDARRAADALDWAVERMEQRYQLLSEKGVRNIEGYNERIAREQPSSEEGEGAGQSAEEEPLEESEEEEMLPEQGKLPYIVIVIDEMADLMILSGKQIEETITRLAQMARAAGIHLLLATQRPSVDVLTGIIKANLPTRISFQVSSRTDSRTILDSIGAEKLLGQGDMLFLPPGTSKVRRIHGAYVSEPEIERVVEYLKRYGKPRYVKIPFRAKKPKEEDEPFEYDEKYDLAVQVVTETRQASISMLQRKLRVGYNRAARMIERMEQEGIVGPQEGVKPREVLVKKLS
jgi:S-DNA-T family DNA segregation ATPase FtsK/SpoIIIE